MTTYFDKIAADKTATVVVGTALTRFAHRCRDVASEALWAQRLVRVYCFVIPERIAELVLVTLKAELLSKFAVLVFEL